MKGILGTINQAFQALNEWIKIKSIFFQILHAVRHSGDAQKGPF